MRQLRLDQFTARLREEGGVVLVQGDDVRLLLEAVLSDALGGVGEGFFVEGLESEVVGVGAFEGVEAGGGLGEGGLELGYCWELVFFFGWGCVGG
jgi:hypothetical protein